MGTARVLGDWDVIRTGDRFWVSTETPPFGPWTGSGWRRASVEPSKIQGPRQGSEGLPRSKAAPPEKN